MRFVTNSEGDTLRFGRALGELLKPGDTVLISGDLGTGKSVLARGIASALDISGPMPSPTFTILIPYEGRHKLYHFDLYRLSDPEEFYQAGLDEFVSGDGIAVVEWPEMAELSVKPAVILKLVRGEDLESRQIDADFSGICLDTRALDGWRTDF